MLYNSDYINKTIISKNIARAASSGVVVTPDVLAEGETVVTDLSGYILDITTVIGKKAIKLVQGRGAGKNLLQVELNLKDTVSYKGGAYSASQQCIAGFGYNGTSGSLTATNNYAYVPFVRLISNTMFLGKQNQLYWYGPYTSGTSGTTQASVAKGIAQGFLLNFKAQYEIGKFIKVERIADGTYGTAVASVTVTKGSKLVTGTGIGTAFTANGLPARFGGNTTTTPVYVGNLVTADSASLDIEWQGETQTLTVNVQTAAPTNWGVMLTGQEQRFDIASFRVYDILNFTTGEANNALTSWDLQAPKEGSGNPPQVQAVENASWGFEGQQYLLGIPPTPRTTDVLSTGTYAALNIGFKKSTNHMNGIGSVKGNVIVYADVNGGAGTNIVGAASSIVDVLDVWASQADFEPQASDMGL